MTLPLTGLLTPALTAPLTVPLTAALTPPMTRACCVLLRFVAACCGSCCGFVADITATEHLFFYRCGPTCAQFHAGPKTQDFDFFDGPKDLGELRDEELDQEVSRRIFFLPQQSRARSDSAEIPKSFQAKLQATEFLGTQYREFAAQTSTSTILQPCVPA